MTIQMKKCNEDRKEASMFTERVAKEDETSIPRPRSALHLGSTPLLRGRPRTEFLDGRLGLLPDGILLVLVTVPSRRCRSTSEQPASRGCPLDTVEGRIVYDDDTGRCFLARAG